MRHKAGIQGWAIKSDFYVSRCNEPFYHFPFLKFCANIFQLYQGGKKASSRKLQSFSERKYLWQELNLVLSKGPEQSVWKINIGFRQIQLKFVHFRPEMTNCFNQILICLNLTDSLHIIFAILDGIRNNFEASYPTFLMKIFPYFHYPLYR